MGISEELAELFERGVSGDLDAASRLRLNALLRESSDLRRAYLDQMQLHCALELRFTPGETSERLRRGATRWLRVAACWVGGLLLALGVYAVVNAVTERSTEGNLPAVVGSEVSGEESDVLNALDCSFGAAPAEQVSLGHGIGEPGEYELERSEEMNTTNLVDRLRLMGAAATMGMAALLPQNVAIAADYQWTGNAGDGLWESAGNWDPATGYPGVASGDSAAIDGSAEITLGGACNFRYFQKNGSLDVANPAIIRLSGGGLALQQSLSKFEVGANYVDRTAGRSRAAQMVVDGTAVRVGTPAAPGMFFVTYNSQANASSVGSYQQTGGSFDVELSELHVGHSTSDKTIAPIQGVLDLRGVEGASLVVSNTLTIHGNREVGRGELLLGEQTRLFGGMRSTAAPAGNLHAGFLDSSTRSGWSGTSVFSVVSGMVDLRFDVMRFGHGDFSGALTSTTLLGPQTVVGLEANQVFVGTGGGNATVVESLFDASGTCDGELKVHNALSIGSGRTTRSGTMLLGANWTVQVGSPAAMASLLSVGSHTSFFGWQTNNGVFKMNGGVFNAYVTNLYVGVNAGGNSGNLMHQGAISLEDLCAVTIQAEDLAVACRNGNNATTFSGELSLKGSTNITLDVNNLRIGVQSANFSCVGTGSVYLGEGVGVAANLLVAVQQSAGIYGVLTLDGMQLSVTNALSLGARAGVTTLLSRVSAGLSLTGEWAASPAATNDWIGINTIVFAAPPAPSKRANTIRPIANTTGPTSIYRGLSWQGDHVAEVEALRSRGKIHVVDELTDVFANQVSVFYDETTATTYLGFRYKEFPAATRIELR